MKKKHPETEYFLYYSIEIEGKTFWTNVKMHKHYKGEQSKQNVLKI